MTRFEKDIIEIEEGNEIEVLKRRKIELEDLYKKGLLVLRDSSGQNDENAAAAPAGSTASGEQNAQNQVEEHARKIQQQVVNADDANKTNTHVDAREKGKNEYFSRKKSGKKKSEQKEDRVIKKGTSNGFDMKV